MTAETAAVLHRAADLLEERGWCQHTAGDNEGRICAATAVSAAAKECDTDPNAAMAALLRHVRVDPDGVRPRTVLGRWNDAPGRSRREVTDALRATADEALHPDTSDELPEVGALDWEWAPEFSELTLCGRTYRLTPAAIADLARLLVDAALAP